MLSDKPGKTPQDQQPSEYKSEIITPIKVRSRSSKAEPSGPRRISIRSLSFFLVVLTLLVATGFIFIRHVSKRPLNLTDAPDRSVQTDLEVSRKGVTNTEKKTTLQGGQSELPLDNLQESKPEQETDPAKGILEQEEAQNFDEVNRLITSGKNHEEQGRFAFAYTDYREALKLDPDSREARESLKRVKEQIAGDQFQKLMSEGLTAYHKGTYESARTILLKAKSFRPDSKEVESSLVQVNEAIRLDTIAKLRRRAAAGEEAEDWEEALHAYRSVLKIDPTISFAVQGKERSMNQIRVAREITYFLQKPGTLESDKQLQNAILLMEEAGTLQPRGQRLSRQLTDFGALVDAARTPIQVRIDSDNLTDVAVYRVGRLGRFATRELLLRPGTYTVVGSRDGYRDIRQQIVVKPGQTELSITIICRDQV